MTQSSNELYGVKDLGVSPLSSLVFGRRLRQTSHEQKLEGAFSRPFLFLVYICSIRQLHLSPAKQAG